MITREYVLTCDASIGPGDVTCGLEYGARLAYVNNLWKKAREAGWTRHPTAIPARHYCPTHPGGDVTIRSTERVTQPATLRSACPVCHTNIELGDLITRGGRVSGWVHAGCYPT